MKANKQEEKLSPFTPKPRGWGNPSMKDPSVREGGGEESQLFDDIEAEMRRYARSKRQPLPSAVFAIRNSIVELRDLQAFMRTVLSETCFKDFDVEFAKRAVHESLRYYLPRMHSTDAEVLVKHVPPLLHLKFRREEVEAGLERLIENLDTMCKINCRVISSTLR